MRQINDAGLALIKSFESLRLSSYDDATGLALVAGGKVLGTPTIGWGHTKDVAAGQICTAAQAEAWLIQDLVPAGAAVEKYVQVMLTANQFAALVSFVFNVGADAFSGSTLLKLLNNRRYDAVPQQLARWNRAGGHISKGLTRRRAAEAALWSTPEAASSAPGAAATHPVDAPPQRGHLITLSGITVGAVSGTLSDMAQQLQPLAEYGGLVKNVFLAIAVAAAAVAVIARMRTFKKEGV